MCSGGTELLNLYVETHVEREPIPYVPGACEGGACDASDLQEPLYLVEQGAGTGVVGESVVTEVALCLACLTTCCDCGEAVGCIQDLSEHRNWLVCAACFEARETARRLEAAPKIVDLFEALKSALSRGEARA